MRHPYSELATTVSVFAMVAASCVLHALIGSGFKGMMFGLDSERVLHTDGRWLYIINRATRKPEQKVRING